MTARNASFEDIALAAEIMVTSFRTAFADFVSPETMAVCTNPDNCRAMLESIYQEGKMHFLMGRDQGFLCWQETEHGAEIVALDKTRNDEDKQQVLYEVNGRFNSWKEIGYCNIINEHKGW